MKAAVIGAGNNGSSHARCLDRMEGMTVVGIADPLSEKAEALASELGAKPFADHREMLDGAPPDVVFISSPCWLHAGHAVDCAAAGAHIMCEKPMALTLEDCDRMIASARENGVVLMIAQSTRYDPALQELKRICESGLCGDLVCAWSTRMSYHRRQPDIPWRMDGDKSGGIVFEWEVHEIDFVCSIGGEVDRIYARTACTREDAHNFMDHFTAVLTFRNGGYGNLEASQSCALQMSGRGFVGSRGAARTEGAEAIRVKTVDMEESEVLTFERPGKMSQDADFIRAVLEGDVPPIPGEDGRANIEIGLAIVESGRTGDVVVLPL